MVGYHYKLSESLGRLIDPVFYMIFYPSKHSSWWRPLQDALIKTNIFALLIFLQMTSSRVFKTSSRRFQDIFKTSSRCCKNVFKASSRHLQDAFQGCLQDVFKTYYQVKLLLVTQFQDIFKTYSKLFLDVLLRRLSTGDLLRSHFWPIYGQCAKFPRVIKVSQVLVFHFITPFSGCLQRRI